MIHSLKTSNSMLQLAAKALTVFFIIIAMGTVKAQDYPSKSLRLIVGFPPGGGSDAFARVLGQRLGEQLNQQVIIDNRPGANGNVGAELAAKAPADGYNLLIVSTSQAVSMGLYSTLNYNLVKDFTPIALIGAVPNTVVVKADLPVNNVKEFIELAKKSKLTYASSGSGSPEHLAGEIFSSMAGIKMVHVPYKGSGQSVIDLAGGQVDSGFNTLPSVINMAKQGKVKVLAVTTSKRNGLNPEIPTVQESGLAGYEMSTWYALVVPTGTPPNIIKKLNEEVNKAIVSTEMKDRLKVIGADPAEPNTLDQAASFINAEIDKYKKTIKEMGIKNE